MTHHCKNRDLTVRMAARYEFGTEEVSFVTGSGESTNKVADIVADAEERRAERAEEHGGDVFDRVEEEAAESETAQAEAGDVEPVDDEADEESATADASGDESAKEAAADDEAQSGLGDFM